VEEGQSSLARKPCVPDGGVKDGLALVSVQWSTDPINALKV
jgi:hypothetical protein